MIIMLGVSLILGLLIDYKLYGIAAGYTLFFVLLAINNSVNFLADVIEGEEYEEGY